MNAIQTKERVDFYMDTTRNGRFDFLTYKKAVNDAVNKFIDDQFGDINEKNVYGFQAIQQVRDNLFTLITSATPALSTGTTINSRYGSFIPNTFSYPADYYTLVAIQTLLGGYTDYAVPTTYNELGPLLNDTFKMPSNTQMYYLENSTGFTIYRGGTGTLTSATLTYIKQPTEFSIGTEANLISAGAGVLTNATAYIAVETSVHNGITYDPGTQFTTANTNLTSGTVILASNTSPIDLPEKVHEEIAKIAAAIMSGTISDYTKYQFVDKEVKES